MEPLQFLLDSYVGKVAYLNFGVKNPTVVTVLAVGPPVHLPAGSDLNALGIAIAASHFTVTDGHVTRDVSGRQLVMESTSTL